MIVAMLTPTAKAIQNAPPTAAAPAPQRVLNPVSASAPPAPEPVELHEELPAADLAAPNTSQLTRLLPVVRRRRRR